MTPDDPRHGTIAGYVAGCNGANDGCQPCADAKYRYEKRLALDHSRGQRRLVDSTGTVRRIRALLALGWTYSDIGAVHGFTQDWAAMVAKSKRANSETRARVAEAYAQLSMKVGPSELGRKRARSKGWLPPLAWDDETIDDPNAKPYQPAKRRRVPKTEEEKAAERDEFIAEVELLLTSDTIHSAVRRLGYSQADSVAHRLRRSGRPDLAARFEVLHSAQQREQRRDRAS